MTLDYPNPRNNRLLAALPEQEWLLLQPQLERVELQLGEVLCESGFPISHAYFPITAVISKLLVMKDGARTETSVVGNEGVIGIPLFLGCQSTTLRTVVKSAGSALRIKKEDLLKIEFNRSVSLTNSMLRFTQALIAQTAACIRHHSIDQQLCRWLLLSLDRIDGNELVMTQKLIAEWLGVRREGVTESELKLQALGIISYVRGHITVLDRDALEKRACECYAVVKAEYDRLLPPPTFENDRFRVM